jgi:predicted extracellular nuclease
VDDNKSTRNPVEVLAGGVYVINSANSLRGGSHVTTLAGPLYINTGFGPYWRVQPESASDLVFSATTNPRPTGPPTVPAADIKIVSTNLLNYFVTVGPAADLRGADSVAEFDRQVQKTVLALTLLNADVFGVAELENLPGNGAAKDLLGRLNAANPARSYTAVSVEAGYDTIGTDAIKVDIIYDKSKFALSGYARLTDSSVDATLLAQSTTGNIFDGWSRVPLAATLTSQAGKHVTIVMNHFKSKGGTGTGADADVANGAGNFNKLRTLSAQAVVDWLETTPTGIATDSMLVMGDLNAYANETPITTLAAAGFVDVTGDEYTYLFDAQFGSLDYVLAKKGTNVAGAAPWHVNSDEPDLIDYNLDYSRDPALFDGNSPFRYSDHDPVVVTLWLGAVVNDKGFFQKLVEFFFSFCY